MQDASAHTNAHTNSNVISTTSYKVEMSLVNYLWNSSIMGIFWSQDTQRHTNVDEVRFWLRANVNVLVITGELLLLSSP